MRTILLASLAAIITVPLSAQWELGVVGGYGFRRDVTVSSEAGATAKARLDSGYAFGAFGGYNDYEYLSGEARYLYQRSPLRLQSGSVEVTEPAHTHVIHFDVLIHTAPRRAAVRPFVALGGGLKVFQGTGVDRAAQPLSNFAILTNTQEVKPLFSPAAGLKVRLSNHFSIRAEARYYLSPVPDKIIAPAPGASMSGWLHDIVPLFGIMGTW
jgi:hypothetical protein